MKRNERATSLGQIHRPQQSKWHQHGAFFWCELDCRRQLLGLLYQSGIMGHSSRISTGVFFLFQDPTPG